MSLPWPVQTGQTTAVRNGCEALWQWEKLGGACLACRCKGQDQACQLRQRHNKSHLVEKLTPECFLDDQFKSNGGESGLFHEGITFNSAAAMTSAVLPKY
jgi:hypothetical protein